MLNGLPLLLLCGIFILGAAAVWIAGIQLSNTTDIIDKQFGFGEALGGLIFLAIATNLPEIAITVSAALTKNIGLATGNILGGIAIQTVVLVLMDAFGLGKKGALSFLSASLGLVLEGILVIAVLILAIMGTQLPASVMLGRLSPIPLMIALCWMLGVWFLSKAKKDLPWQLKGQPAADKDQKSVKKVNTGRAILIFCLASLITFIAGAALELSGDAIAHQIGLSGVLFGATILAAATALPEISTGLQSMRIGDYELGVSDIFGGNAFLPVLFLLANLISGQAVLPQAQKSDVYLAALGCLLTAVYLYGLIFRRSRQVFHLGIDSIVVLVLYLIGIVGLFFMPG
ncbi:sodium:calcium antiporter [Tengunoibacter tsumagoiensis]|uniref:Sodium/calcium exchanger membrane region domain-containing protein n=1 Tax=Tengunoibacter tsumagoiensis TaxID=2014871 RepID=A0A401ZZF3_9CHLR|nr:sodium:calcium antiporter [Tengunoibacter tsumagoiensis]GCE12213.1 hypothetical protein KTT_20720 [Tengunoibacter tsumagoiensis]